jgi:ABC-type spermidine/putrescine transport system permease subunit I
METAHSQSDREIAQDDRLLRASKKLRFWVRFTSAFLILCVVEAVILVAGGLYELIQIAPHLQQYQEFFPDENPTRMSIRMIWIGGISTVIFSVPSVAFVLTSMSITQFVRTGDASHLLGFARWFRRSLIVAVLLTLFYVVFVQGYAFYLRIGSPT